MTNIIGIDINYFSVNKIKVLKGRALNDMDINQGNNVILISKALEEKMYSKESPIGKS